uniref:Uncharacterized protein n=1 Tax=Meloidogyne enterolobii TaxID=390850 RepID=A0A6V7WEU9_MELEN|nr:unnamed protein product [Meloidogyne enterolobii]
MWNSPGNHSFLKYFLICPILFQIIPANSDLPAHFVSGIKFPYILLPFTQETRPPTFSLFFCVCYFSLPFLILHNA